MDRRTLLGALAVAPAIVATGAPALAASRTAWDEALARYRASETVFSETDEAWAAALGAYYDARPAEPSRGITIYKHGQTFTTEDAFDNAKAEHAAWELADRECRASFGCAEKEAVAALAAQHHHDAYGALLECPAPDLKAAITKLELIQSRSNDDEDLAAVLADLSRFA